jgi:hypothetical protein
MLSSRTPLGLVAAALAVSLLCAGVSLADDGAPPDAPPLVAPDGPFLGVLPQADPSGITDDDAPPDAQVSRPLVYRGGAVMHSSTVYAIYWIPSGFSVSRNYAMVINGFLADVAHDSAKHSNVYATDTQYYEVRSGEKHHVSYSVTFGGSVVDTSPFPASGCPPVGSVCLLDSQLKTELSRVIRSHGWSSGYSRAFFLFLPRRVDLCMGSSTCTYTPSGGFCAYHSYYGLQEEWSNDGSRCLQRY